MPIAASQPNGLNRGQLTVIGTIVVVPGVLAGRLTLGAVAGK